MEYGEITKKDIELIDIYVKECGAYIEEGRSWRKIKALLLRSIENEETNNAN